jgi:hypothetical protein
MGVMNTKPGIDIRDARRGRSFSTKYQHVRIPEMAPHPPALGAIARHHTLRKHRDHAAQQAIGLSTAIGSMSDDRLYKKQASVWGELLVRSLASPSPATQPAFAHPEFVKNARLLEWVSEIARLTQPASIHWCDGSQAECESLCSRLVAGGTFRRLNPAKRPDSCLALSDPSDVARVEDRTFICSADKQEAGSTNNWLDPREMKRTLLPLFDGSMRGRTMYIVPFSMGPIGSALSQAGVQITDCAYVVVSMRIMTSMGRRFSMHSAPRAASFPAYIASACRWRPDRRICRGRATRMTSRSCIFPRKIPSGRSAAAMMEMRC